MIAFSPNTPNKNMIPASYIINVRITGYTRNYIKIA